GVHDVDLRHAHALAQEPFARCTLQLRHGRPEIGDDGRRQVRRWRDSLCHMNNIADADHPVNLNGPCRVQESDALRPDDRTPAGAQLWRPGGDRYASRGKWVRYLVSIRSLSELSRPDR